MPHVSRSGYAERRASLKDTSITSWSSIPRAEKNLIKELAISIIFVAFVCHYVSVLNPTNVVVLAGAFCLLHYLLRHKPRQDALVRQHYRAVGSMGPRDGSTREQYYRTSPAVKGIGGPDAIHNACAWRLLD